MKIVFLFFVLMSSFLLAGDLKAQNCDEKSENSSSLKGSFLKKGELVGQACENKIQNLDKDTSLQSPDEEKKLNDFKNFVNSSR